MEYVAGVDLERLIQVTGPLGVADACELIRQAAIGLACIHARGWIHRDLKPSNLLLSEEGVVKIADLGLARAGSPTAVADPEGIADPTRAGQWVGTPDYMAPEQARDSRTVDGRADLYSLGCTLFRLLTGQVLYPSSRFPTVAEKLVAHLREPIPLVSDVLRAAGHAGDPATLAAVDAVLRRLVAKDPADRFADSEAVIHALTPLATGWDPTRVWTSYRPRDRSVDAVSSVTTGSEQANVSMTATTLPLHSAAPPQARRSHRALIPGLFLLATLIPVGWLLSGNLRPVEETPPAQRDLDGLAVLCWHNLLDRPPREVSWPRNNGASRWSFDAALQEVFVHNHDLGMLELGMTTAPHYILRVGLFQNRWKGGLALHVGCRLPTAERPVGRSQFFQLREESDRAGRTHFNISRGFVTLTQRPDGLLAGSATVVASSRLSNVRGEQTLEVAIADHRVAWVKVNGGPLKDLLGKNIDALFTSEDAIGGLGLLVGSSDGLFRNAQFQLLTAPP